MNFPGPNIIIILAENLGYGEPYITGDPES